MDDSVKWYALQLVARDLEGLASRLRRRSVDRMALAELCEDFARRLELAATEPGAVYCWRDAPTGFTACDRAAGHLGPCSWAAAADSQPSVKFRRSSTSLDRE